MNARIQKYLVLFLFLASLALAAGAASRTSAAGVWYVATTGNDSSNCQSPATACASIPAVLAKAGFIPGDLVKVATGSYYSTGTEVLVLDKSVALSGGWDAAFGAQTGISSLDGMGQGSRRILIVNQGVTASLDRFDLRNGTGVSGGIGIVNHGSLTFTHGVMIFIQTNYGNIIENHGDLVIRSSVLKDSMGDYGGILNTDSASLVIVNSTLHNLQTAYKAAILNDGVNPTARLYNTTITGNYGGSGTGSGIIREEGTVTLYNSLVADNTGGSDCWGEIHSGGYNLIGKANGCNFIAAAGDVVDQAANLGPFENDVKPLLPNSLAVNGGDPSGCKDDQGAVISVDQRGKSRWNRCDIGAYELQPLGYSTKSVTPGPVVPGETLNFIISVANPGAAAIAGAQVSDTLPAAATYTASTLVASSGTAQYSGGVITWNGDVPAGKNVTIQFDATVSAGTSLGTIWTNTAQISGAGETFNRSGSFLVDNRIYFLPQVCRPCAPIFTDDFSNPASGWAQFDDPIAFLGYVGGEYRMLIKEPNYWIAASIGSFGAYDPYAMSVDVRSPSGDSVYGSYGLVMGATSDWARFYEFDIDPYGNYTFYRQDMGYWYEIASGYSAAIKTGTASNRLKYVYNGYAHADFYVNGQYLFGYDAWDFAGMIGLIGFAYNQGGVDIYFDNFAIWPYSCQPDVGRSGPQAQAARFTEPAVDAAKGKFQR